MKNLFLLFFACLSLSMPVCAQADDTSETDDEEVYEEVDLESYIDHGGVINSGPQRTPPRVPSDMKQQERLTIHE